MNKRVFVFAFYLLQFVVFSSYPQQLSKRAESMIDLWKGVQEDSIGYYKIEVGLNLLDVFQQEGLEDTEIYDTVDYKVRYEIMNDYLNGPVIGSIDLFYQYLRYDELNGKVFFGTSYLEKCISKELKQKVEQNSNLLYWDIEDWGRASRIDGKLLLCKTVYSGVMSKAIVMEFDDDFIPILFYEIDRDGVIREYLKGESGFVQTRQRKLVRHIIDHDNSILLSAYCNPQIGEQIVPLVSHKDNEAYTVRFNENHIAVQTNPVVVQGKVFPRNRNTTNIHSFIRDGKEYISLSPNVQIKYFEDIDDLQIQRLEKSLMNNGYSEYFTNIITGNIIKEGYQLVLVGGTLFRWWEKGLKRGNYEVIGLNSWETGVEKLFMAYYKKNKLVRLDLSDGTVYDNFTEQSFKSTYKISGTDRSFVTTLNNEGYIQNSELFFDSLDYQIQYSQSSIQTNLDLIKAPLNRAYSKIRYGYGDGRYIIEKVGNRDYYLGHLDDLVLSRKAYRVLDNENHDIIMQASITGNSLRGLIPGAYQQVVHLQDEEQYIDYFLPKYGTSEPVKLGVELIISKLEGILTAKEDGTTSLHITRSNSFGQLIDDWEEIYK